MKKAVRIGNKANVEHGSHGLVEQGGAASRGAQDKDRPERKRGVGMASGIPFFGKSEMFIGNEVESVKRFFDEADQKVWIYSRLFTPI